MSDKSDNVVPFARPAKQAQQASANQSVALAQPQEKRKIDWAHNLGSEQAYTKAVYIIETHSTNIMELVAEYIRRNELFDPSSLTEDQYRDMILIKESLIAMFSRRVGLQHDLHKFVAEQMHIPLPNNE